MFLTVLCHSKSDGVLDFHFSEEKVPDPAIRDFFRKWDKEVGDHFRTIEFNDADPEFLPSLMALCDTAKTHKESPLGTIFFRMIGDLLTAGMRLETAPRIDRL